MGKIITVNFRGDDLYGFENDDGIFVALKPIVESMGMDWSAQLQRVKRDPILAEGMVIMTTPLGQWRQPVFRTIHTGGLRAASFFSTTASNIVALI